MKKNDEFFVGYLDEVGPSTRKKLKRTVLGIVAILVLGAALFAFFQKPFANSTFELTKKTKLTGVYHESPYPLLRTVSEDGEIQNVLLVGFGKRSVLGVMRKLGDVHQKTLDIEGNLIYYDGKTVLQVVIEEDVSISNSEATPLPEAHSMGNQVFEGEIVDPKCFFGVMKPGHGKIHRSCAVRCISGGIPPVLATTDDPDGPKYLMLVNEEGQPLDASILPHVGKSLRIHGELLTMDDWHLLKVQNEGIVHTEKPLQFIEDGKCQSDCAHLHIQEAFAMER